MKTKVTPPRLFLRFFRWYCHPKMQDYIEGDLMEVYERRVKASGKKKADITFIIDVLLLCRPGIIRPVNDQRHSNGTAMLVNYLKVGFRNIQRSLSYSLINVAGLALGITCALLIFLLVSYHLSFDTFHANSDRIYRFVTEEHRDEINRTPSVPPVFGKAFREDYTYGEKVARLCTETDQLVTIVINEEAKKFQENVSFAEPEFFDIFNFPLIAGKRSTLLTEPNTAIITERIAKKYFRDESPLNKTFKFDNHIEFTITGLLQDIPNNTEFRSEIYLSYSTIKQYNEWYAADDSWGGITTSIQTFVRMRPGVDPVEVENQLPAYVKKYREKSKNVHHYKLQPMADVHYNADYEASMSMNIIWILSVIGFFLIFTACLNFINLATAQAITRAKEVGVRKVLGSQRLQLFLQFTIETGLIVTIASLIATGIVYSVIPYFNTTFDARISFNPITDITFISFALMLILVVTLLSGAYPGLVLSGFKPVVALKGKFASMRRSGFNLRRSLVITQFTISQVLLIGLIVVVFQMRYNKETNMGFTREGIVMLPSGPDNDKKNALRDQILQLPNVENASLCFSAPASENHWGTSFVYDNRNEAEDFSVSFRGADEKYISTFGIELVAGRDLTPSDTVKEFLVNEVLVSKLGLSSPEEILGRTVRINRDWAGPVVGVISNFHDHSFRDPLSPIVITTRLGQYHEVAVKIRMTNMSETLAALEKTWTAMYPEQIYSYQFVDDQTAQFYRAEEAMLTLTEIFALIALLIGCMGLYGLTSFMAVQKNKEIGIRKVLGGDITQILMIFGKEFSLLVLIAFAIAAPLGWWLMTQWLGNYQYKIDLTIWIFVIELAIIFAIVIFTVGYQSLKAALMNPVKSLRSE